MPRLKPGHFLKAIDLKFKYQTPNKIIVHCADTPNHQEFTAEDIRRWHVRNNKWLDIGYHYVIRRSGVIESGRLETEVGSHVKSYNTNSIGICFVGRDAFTINQYSAFHRLIFHLNQSWGISADEVFGHYEFTSKKSCPNIDMDFLRETIRKNLIDRQNV